MRHNLLALFLFYTVAVNAQTTNDKELTHIIMAQDSLLFQIGFNTCNTEVFDRLLSDDFEFYHDKSGMSNKTKFLTDLKNGLCADRVNYRSRRALAPESTIVSGLYNDGILYGAIQEGTHVFYEQISDKPESLAGSARFTHLWLLKKGEWKLARSLSFEHRSARTESEITKAEILQIRLEILENRNHYEIWNLMEIDTNELIQITGNFSDSFTESTLILLQGSAGGSAGSADNLLVLLKSSTETDKLNVLWAGQSGDFNVTDVKDLTNDGIPEIVIRSGFTWMGEAGETFEIVNFKNGTINRLFSARSQYVFDWEDESLLNHYRKGDTLEVHYECSLVPQQDKSYAVQREETLCLHDGGKSIAEIRRKMKIIRSKSIVKLQ